MQALTGQIGNGFAVSSTGSKVFLKFRSDNSESEKGFKIRYEGILIMNNQEQIYGFSLQKVLCFYL